jgi:methylated-DNA-[protein]-cysteine S-methyltransferase
MSRTYTTMASPVGELLLTADEEGRLSALWLPGDPLSRHARARPGDARRDDGALAPARTQLEEYFAGERTAFDLPVAPAGTPFQQSVWAQLRRIPYGTTTTYGELAARLGRPTAVRAVGAANGANPVSIVIPCHRVIGASGLLTGYGGGLAAKRRLLDLERAAAA